MALYKPPLAKKIADLQWRLLHGIVAVNSFITLLNPSVSNVCPFCPQRETIFHRFFKSRRLSTLFFFLEKLFMAFGESFTKLVFIFGFKYRKNCSHKCELLNLVI